MPVWIFLVSNGSKLAACSFIPHGLYHSFSFSHSEAYTVKKVISMGRHPCRVKYSSLEDWRYYNQALVEIPPSWYPQSVCVYTRTCARGNRQQTVVAAKRR